MEAPSSLPNLPSLSVVDLSGNNFESLPPTIFSNLSNLWHLNLRYCSRLRSLPELPPTLRFLETDECTSLESFMGSLILYRGIGKGVDRVFTFGNCLKLKNKCNNMLESMVKGVHLAQETAEKLYVRLPGLWVCLCFSNLI